MFKKNDLVLDHFKYSMINKAMLDKVPLIHGKRDFSKYLSSLEENSLEVEAFYNSLGLL